MVRYFLSLLSVCFFFFFFSGSNGENLKALNIIDEGGSTRFLFL